MENELTANYALTPSELMAAVSVMVSCNPPQPAFIWGPPGIGKSDVARLVAADFGMEHRDIRATLLESVDLRGVPRTVMDTETEEYVTEWAPPSFLPRTSSRKRYLLVFDELPSAPPMVQNALYQLILDRRCGEYELPAGACMVACGNRETDRGATYSMPAPLANRFVHLNLETCFDEWEHWAREHNIRPEIIQFLRYHRGLLQDFDPRQKREKAFPTPRSWSFVNNIMQHKGDLPPHIERKVYCGAVGEPAGVQFFGFLEHYRHLPDLDTIFADPRNADIPKQVDRLIALAAALSEEATVENFGPLLIYGRRLREANFEIAQYLVDCCIRCNPDLRQTREWVAWQVESQ